MHQFSERSLKQCKHSHVVVPGPKMIDQSLRRPLSSAVQASKMAAVGKDRPNLKICIDNTDDFSDSDDSSSDSDIAEASEKSEEEAEVDIGVSDDSEEEGEISVTVNEAEVTKEEVSENTKSTRFQVRVRVVIHVRTSRLSLTI